uniref:Uncharacterized protein n=1 Tax=Arundo donax TaxID=35708 RepID=A0A0A8Z0U1_ARUDO
MSGLNVNVSGANGMAPMSRRASSIRPARQYPLTMVL